MITKEENVINKLIIDYKHIEMEIRDKCIKHISKLIQLYTTYSIFNLADHNINITLKNGSLVKSIEYYKTANGSLWVQTDCDYISDIDNEINAMEYYGILLEIENYFNSKK